MNIAPQRPVLLAMADSRFPIAELLRSDAFAHPVSHLDVVETHISWVILTGTYAYKIKKAVHYDFIDASTLEQRRKLCEEELRLNRRLAAELYLAVVPIGREHGRLHMDSSHEVIEYAVRMREFDRSQELAALLAAHEVQADEVGSLAQRLAEFHAQAPPAAEKSAFGRYEQVRETLLGNIAALNTAGVEPEFRHVLTQLTDWTQDAVARHREEIDFRRVNGAVRECHGDLHARNVVRWRGKLVPFDSLEFNPGMRWIDVMSEIAFLHMDLVGHDRSDLASTLLSRYLETGGDYHGLPLLRFYAVYRALVRAKVDALQAAGTDDPRLGAELRARSADRIHLARRFTDEADPCLIIMSGVSGSGKSWLSEQLVPALAAVRVRSDIERKRILGTSVAQPGHAGLNEGPYAAQSTDRTYARLLECAESSLAGGQSTIVDAAFLNTLQRELFLGLARRRRARFLIVRCSAEPGLLRDRVRSREAGGQDASEATLAVLAHQLATQHPLQEREQACTIEIDTGALGSPRGAIDAVRRRLESASCP